MSQENVKTVQESLMDWYRMVYPESSEKTSTDPPPIKIDAWTAIPQIPNKIFKNLEFVNIESTNVSDVSITFTYEQINNPDSDGSI